jgi:hypothetical protein
VRAGRPYAGTELSSSSVIMAIAGTSTFPFLRATGAGLGSQPHARARKARNALGGLRLLLLLLCLLLCLPDGSCLQDESVGLRGWQRIHLRDEGE